ncbi:MAG: hypothetical protein HY907_09555 [Deltaproteobacteria bacterium]|nr:hypothetical protein [Deltaproteobacteria bacterium]
MKFWYRPAIVSLCSDLTDPRAGSVPVAVFLVAQAGPWCFAAAASRKLTQTDPITAMVLSDIPRLLKDQVDKLRDSKSDEGDSSLDSILFSLRHSLRNSLHVSDILTGTTEILPEGMSETAIAGAFFGRLMEMFERQVARSAVGDGPSWQPAGTDHRQACRDASQFFPDVSAWPLALDCAPSSLSAAPA